MKLTTAQRSEIISEPTSSEVAFNELVRILLNRFSKQERALFLDEHKGEQGNGSVLVVGVDTVAVFNFASQVLTWGLFNRLDSASWLLRKGSVRCFS
jgi:transposase, mutator family